MTQPMPVPEWAVRTPTPTPDGITPPAEPSAARVDLTAPDANGHQWIVLGLGDSTLGVTVRMPWQTAPGFLAAITERVMQLAEQAAGRAGPQIVVPPAGIDLSKLRPNGHGQNGGSHGRP
jgi:hypothetical protein